jgi:hypothetical protein
MSGPFFNICGPIIIHIVPRHVLLLTIHGVHEKYDQQVHTRSYKFIAL